MSLATLELQGYYTFTKGFYHLAWLDFPFKNLAVWLKGYDCCIIAKDWCIDTKSDDKESVDVAVFPQKENSTFLSLVIGMLGESCVFSRGECEGAK